ncbi:hypothetical protein [Streptomyces sp. NPDC005017]|uniref:hypothetical protein n=1 Tax=Streptomyces sp. NPDC005017 TaxID=3364706 RepID=UPI0036C2D83B
MLPAADVRPSKPAPRRARPAADRHYARQRHPCPHGPGSSADFLAPYVVIDGTAA